MKLNERKKVVIVGAGFAGVKAALKLASYNDKNLNITLVSNKTHFEYHATLYRVASGCSPYEVCIPLSEIFKDKSVNIVKDTVKSIDLQNNCVTGSAGDSYHYDFLLLGLGSEAAYFNLPGVKDNSFSFKNIEDALKIKKHLFSTFKACVVEDSVENKKCDAHIVVIGGGASGVEMAGQLAEYCSEIAKQLHIEPDFLRIDLVESADRVLSKMSPEASLQAQGRLEDLGINVILNKTVLKEDTDTLYIKDASIKSKTVIWTAGIVANSLLKNTIGFELNPRGQVLVTESLNPKGFYNVYAAGDCAATKYSGWAQTAIYDGDFIADKISDKLGLSNLNRNYDPLEPINYIPIGNRWALVDLNGFVLGGFFGWLLRRYFDFEVYTSFLPFDKAVKAMFSSWIDKDSCKTCKELE